ncbi:hypothetical protein Q1695_002580 [Nippostrongylus brasiliensis]|nr:hypothetical protein Q1695_002580 [Nippostrongylus brasiliensis]
MSDTTTMKSVLLGNLSKFVASAAGVRAVDILQNVFDLSSQCRLYSETPRELLSDSEQRQLRDDLIVALPQFDMSLLYSLGRLGIESASRFHPTRSGLEFLHDDFIEGDEELERSYRQLMDGYGVTQIELNLENWRDEPSDLDADLEPYDLRGVPESHNWWSDAERVHSSVAYGAPPAFMNS